MKKFYPLLALVLFVISVHAQDAGVDAATSSTPIAVARNDDPKPDPPKRSKVEIPPEKARPMNVPKIDPVAMAIDGRPDEEAWKTATVFKDFYQTAPGDNIAPSKPTEVLMMYDEKHLY